MPARHTHITCLLACLNDCPATASSRCSDALCDKHRVQKVETAGDCYIVAAGILEPDDDGFFCVREQHDPVDSAARVMSFAQDMLRCAQQVIGG